MAESMWGDVKKLSDLLYRQTREQKDILLLKLRLASFSSKRDTAFARLGGLVYKPLKDGKDNIAEDKEVRASLDELVQIEKDVAKTEKELKELRSLTADQRSELGRELGKTWEKTKTAIAPKASPESDSRKSKGKTKSGGPGEPVKEKKQAKPKTAAGKNPKESGKVSKESEKA
jgi:hypothetical protein